MALDSDEKLVVRNFVALNIASVNSSDLSESINWWAFIELSLTRVCVGSFNRIANSRPPWLSRFCSVLHTHCTSGLSSLIFGGKRTRQNWERSPHLAAIPLISFRTLRKLEDECHLFKEREVNAWRRVGSVKQPRGHYKSNRSLIWVAHLPLALSVLEIWSMISCVLSVSLLCHRKAADCVTFPLKRQVYGNSSSNCQWMAHD